MQCIEAEGQSIFSAARRHPIVAGALLIISLNAQAAPSGPGLVVADLPVTHSLVSMVMGDIASPTLLIQGNASPHDNALRPSQASSLQTADLLIWTSRELSPWLFRALQTSRRPIDNIELMADAQTIQLAFRHNDKFDDDHDHEQDHSEHSDTTPIDPHGWLDPENGIHWLTLIADKLSVLDPDNAASYRSNASAAQQRLKDLQRTISEQLEEVSDLPFIVFHDSYHYFEDRFNVYARAAIALGDAELPGISRMNKLRQQLMEFEGACVFTEPQFSDRLVKSLTRGMSLPTGSLDPLGSALPHGPDLYPQVLREIAAQLHDCLTRIMPR